jgi:cytochrome c oxidase cbb3-type subunit 3
MTTPERSGEAEKVVHVYDDIHEEDNQLPNWWLAILFGSIVFSFGYWFVFHTTKQLPSPPEAYRAELDAMKQARAAANPMGDEALADLAEDPAVVAAGKDVFLGTCASCHGQQANGLVGPNLTDKYWIHGATPGDLAKAIDTGFPDKGMPPWGPILGPDKVRKVVAYVLSVRNTNVAGKEPQGDPTE